MQKLQKLKTSEISLVDRGANRRRFMIFKRAVAVEKEVLSSEDRNALKDKTFALPDERKYPIPDLSHARNALARVSQHGTEEEKKKVRAAVYRKFPELKKVEKGMSTHEELQKAIAGVDPEMMKRVGDVLDKHMTNDAGENNSLARTMVQAVARILSNGKDKISPALIHEAVDAAGFKVGEGELGGAGATTVGEAPSHGETVNMGMQAIPEEHLMKAKECAEKAYDAELKKLGHREYPDAQVQMKSKTGKAMEKSKKMAAEEEEEEEEGVEKSAKLDADTQAKLESVFKQFEDVTKENKDLRTEIKALQTLNDNRELVQKAASFESLGIPQELLVQQLADAKKSGAEAFERITKTFEMLTEREKVAKSFGGSLYREIGSSLPGGSAGSAESTWARIEKAALSMVEKSGEKLGKAESVSRFLETAEGIRMYDEHQKSRKDGI